MLGLLFGWGFGAVAQAGPHSAQVAFEVEQGPLQVGFNHRWRDASGKVQDVAFSLPADEVLADRDEITWLRRQDLNDAAVKAVRRWGRDIDGVKVGARAEGGRVLITVRGPHAKRVLKQATTVRDEAIDRWLTDHDFTRLRNGDVTFDHAALVEVYDERLAPVASALRVGTDSDRAFAERALSFVQAIPYEARKRKGGDPGYRRPLALLFRNRGDCDSKAVLFLALVHAELPDLPLVVIYVPGHVLVGVGAQIGERSEDEAFTFQKRRFLYAEPVGPALAPLGTPAPEDRRAGKKGEVNEVP